MNHDTELKLIDECIENRNGKTTTLGESETYSAASRYTSKDHYDLEIERVFKKLPSALAHSSEIPEPNRYRQVQTALGNLIVTRDPDGGARVFHNACRHRGARIVTSDRGCSKRLTCPYHAWSYTTDGKLASIPGEEHCFPNFDKGKNGLIEIPSSEKYGFVWACPTAGDNSEAESILDQHLGKMVDCMQWLKPENFKVFQRTSKVWKGNWKLFSEGGLETYHFGFAHKDSIAPFFYNNTAVIDNFGDHFRVVMPTRKLEEVEQRPRNERSIHDCSHTLFTIIPNSSFLIQKAHVDWVSFRTLSENQTEITVTTLVPADANLQDEDEMRHWQKNHDITNMTLNEDWELGVSIQESLDSGVIERVVYGKNEWALNVFNERLDAIIDRA